MKKFTIIVALIIAVAFVGSAFASSPGKTVEYPGLGKAIFDGKTHADAGLKCMDCHPKLFQMKKGSFKMPYPHKGESCGVSGCHDGQKAFGQVEPDTCAKCHQKSDPCPPCPCPPSP